MDAQKCSIPGCEKPPKYICKCMEPNLFICKSHVNRHGEYSIGGSYMLAPFFAKLSDDEITILKRAKKRLIQIKNDSISEITKQYLDKLSVSVYIIFILFLVNPSIFYQ